MLVLLLGPARELELELELGAHPESMCEFMKISTTRRPQIGHGTAGRWKVELASALTAPGRKRVTNS